MTAHIGPITLIRTVDGGGSYLSASDPRIHFGLGDASRIDRLEVGGPRGGWRSGPTWRPTASSSGPRIRRIRDRGQVREPPQQPVAVRGIEREQDPQLLACSLAIVHANQGGDEPLAGLAVGRVEPEGLAAGRNRAVPVADSTQRAARLAR